MVYLRNFKGAILLLCFTTLAHLSLWFVYFASLSETGDKNFVALWLFAIIFLAGILALFVLTWISAKARDNRSKLGFKKSVLASLCSFAAYFGVSLVSPVQLGFIESFNAVASSMSPTVEAGDYILSTKVKNNPGLDRGDVVFFYLPENNSVTYIKRIVGLPGDQVQIKNGILNVNDRLVTRVKKDSGETNYALKYNVYEEVLPEGKKYSIWEVSDNQLFDNTPTYTVPNGYYFVLGDNRDNSRDSRSGSIGFIPAENIYRKARLIYFSNSLDRVGLIIR